MRKSQIQTDTHAVTTLIQLSMKQSLGVSQTGLNVLILIFNQSQTSCLLHLSVSLSVHSCFKFMLQYVNETAPVDLGAETEMIIMLSEVFNDLEIRTVLLLPLEYKKMGLPSSTTMHVQEGKRGFQLVALCNLVTRGHCSHKLEL